MPDEQAPTRPDAPASEGTPIRGFRPEPPKAKTPHSRALLLVAVGVLGAGVVLFLVGVLVLFVID